MRAFVLFLVIAFAIQVVTSLSSTNKGWVETTEALHPQQETKFYVFLKQRNIPVLKDIFWDVSNPRSQNYGKYLGQKQIADLVAPDDHVIQEVRKWIHTVPHVSVELVPHRDAFVIRSTVDSTERLFNVKLSLFRHASSDEPVVRSSTRASLPPNVAQHLDLVTGIHDFPFVKATPQVPQPSISGRSVRDSNAPAVTFTTASDTELYAIFTPFCYDGSESGQNADPLCVDHPPAITGFYLYSLPAYETSTNVGVTEIDLEDANCDYDTAEKAFQCSSPFSGRTSTGASTPLPYVYYNVKIQAIYADGSLSNNGSAADLAVAAPYPTPNLIKTHYGIPLNYTVKNQTITQSIFSKNSPYNITDLFEFLNIYNLPNASVQITGINNQTVPGEEGTLDIEMITSIATGSPTLFLALSPDQGVTEWAIYINSLNDSQTPLVHSISYSQAEVTNDPEQLEYYERADTEIIKMGTRGLTVLVSSGDGGASGLDVGGSCDSGQPNWPPSSPYVTAVGGTIFAKFTNPNCFANTVLDCSNYTVGEIVASYDTSCRITSGGGFSNLYEQPSYQINYVSPYLANLPAPIPSGFANIQGRAYPDLSAVGHDIPIILGGALDNVDGTSASTPIVAGIVTLLNSVRANAGQPSLGFLNPLLYQIATDHPSAFYDVTVGDNRCGRTTDQCCDFGYSATAGWDAVTGLGTINYTVLASVITSYGPNPPSSTTQEFTSSSSSTSGNVTSSTTGNLTTTTTATSTTGVAVNTTTSTSTSGSGGVVAAHVLLLSLVLLCCL